MRSFEYASAATAAEAISLLGADGGVRPLAGGTDLLTLIKLDVAAPSRLVDVKRVAELPKGIEDGPDGLTLGTLATLAQVESSGPVNERYVALAQAAGLAATPQLRNMATVGGNLLQRPRCWYFRSPHFACWLRKYQQRGRWRRFPPTVAMFRSCGVAARPAAWASAT